MYTLPQLVQDGLTDYYPERFFRST